MNDIGKLMVAAGVVLILVGAAVWFGVGRSWFGRLPGDVNYSRDNFSFHFPIITCLLLSVLLTIVLRLFRR